MKKYKLYKTTSILLAGTLAISTMGCSYSNVSQSPKTSHTVENTYVMPTSLKTSDCYLIRIDGNIYLTTSKTKSEYLLTNFGGYRPMTEKNYYDVKTGNFVGKRLIINTKDKALYEICTNKVGKGTIEFNNDDINFYNGEYGYQKLLPRSSEIPLKELVTEEYLNNSKIEFYSSNSEELINRINSKYKLYKSYERSTGVTYELKSIAFGFGRDYTCRYNDPTYNYLSYFKCLKDDGSIDVYIGYRCSEIPKEQGYNQIYDVISSSIIYIGKDKENSYTSVKEEKYEEDRILASIINQYNNVINNEEKSEIIEEQQEIIEETIDANALVVIKKIDDISTYASVNIDLIPDEYHILSYKDTVTYEYGGQDIYYEDIKYPDSEASISENSFLYTYDTEDGLECIWCYVHVIDNNGQISENCIMSLKEALKDKPELIKDKYSYSELSEILNMLNQKDNDYKKLKYNLK